MELGFAGISHLKPGQSPWVGFCLEHWTKIVGVTTHEITGISFYTAEMFYSLRFLLNCFRVRDRVGGSQRVEVPKVGF